ncbi:hypothetical protein, partial [Streptococcus pseudopneumoniae]|uniref:hypothetical protein n=1 Tax=Streptococcus pseudopneumoniae TaxID=257758 RepID=UPI001C6FCEEE
ASNLCFFVFILFFLSKKAHPERQCNKINPPLSFLKPISYIIRIAFLLFVVKEKIEFFRYFTILPL